MTLKEYQAEVHSMIHVMLSALESAPSNQAIRPPKDLQGLRAIVQGVSDELMLCADANTAISALQKNQGALLAAILLCDDLPVRVRMEGLRRAHATMPEQTTTLVGMSLATYLLTMCDLLDESLE